ncbi:predicted protein [Chaetoceros tenuissimus]|uniref:Uncharacterized protein n=1 Tax=Chaetoceros tenuissimus TaxID=426638 RepID=A0AAD3D441_9STRA|nr:predicted protein [Chaetoceros tenuissimus]
MNVKSYSYPSISSAPSFDEFLGCHQAVVPNTPIQCLGEPSSPPKLKRRGAWLGSSSFAPIEEDEDLARNNDLLFPSLDDFTTSRIHAVLPFRLQAKRKRSSYTDETSGSGNDPTSTSNTNESHESKTTQQAVEFYGEKLSNIPHNLRMTDTKKRLTIIIRDQDPIHKEHNCVTNINIFRPKLNKKDKQILDDLIEKHKRLAVVAEETQMEMIHLTIDKLGLDVIGKNISFSLSCTKFLILTFSKADIDHRSKQHMELLGREEMIQIEADKDILRKKMPHATAMKLSRGLNIQWKQPLEVAAALLDAGGMLDDGITADIVYERFLLCVDRNFCSEDFDVEHYRLAVYMILDALSMTLFTEAQREEVRRRISVGQKRRFGG